MSRYTTSAFSVNPASETVTDLPVIPPLPEALTGGSEVIELDADSMWSAYLPHEVSFFKLGLLVQLRQRPYHTVTVTGDFALNRLMEHFGHFLYRSDCCLTARNTLQIGRMLFCMGEGVFAYFEPGEIQVYGPTPQACARIAREFQGFAVKPPANQPFFYVVSVSQDGPTAITVRVDRQFPASAEELALHYGGDFCDWEQQWLEKLRQRAGGLTVLHGPPGCGKTSYLRALMARLISSHQFYYLPMTEVQLLTDPRFVSFWLRQARIDGGKPVVTVIEDAEALLLPRDGASRDKVSDLLNIADGFLGDYLKMNVIATTNANLDKLDPAISRPGRLIGVRGFRRLNRAEALRLAQARNLSVGDQPDYSLAEIYNGGTEAVSGISHRQIGFA